jgi:hypothetical protein
VTGSTLNRPSDDRRLTRIAGIAGLAAPIAWALVAGLELAHANIGHSIISRPERFFSDSAWHWPLVLAVVLMVAAQVTAALGLLRRVAGIALLGLALVGIGAGRVALALLLPSDPRGYTVSVQAALSSDAVLVALPIVLILAAILVRRRSPGLAWLSAAIAVAMPSVALWATVWSARSGASQPQLLAVEPVECLASIWAAAVGVWLLGWPARLTGTRPAIPSPGRWAALALALVAIAGVVTASGGPTALIGRPT